MVEYMHSDPCSHRTTDACKPKKSLLASSPLVILRFPFVLAKCQECNDINNTKINDKIFVHVFYKKTKFQNSAPFTSRNSYLFLLFYHIFRNLFKQDFTISWLLTAWKCVLLLFRKNQTLKTRKDNTFPGFLRYFFLVSHNEHMDI